MEDMSDLHAMQVDNLKGQYIASVYCISVLHQCIAWRPVGRCMCWTPCHVYVYGTKRPPTVKITHMCGNRNETWCSIAC